ncbi:hypothetical protein DFH06DRAFT_1221183 [Mycena polygramma]|nr:hypothetical protein DFH06DRAFT_1221183 [Mycena polygramma]
MGSTVYNFPVTFKHHSDTSANCPPRARFDTAALRTAKKVFKVPKYETVQDIADDESRDAELGFSGVDLTHVDTYSMSRKGKERETTARPRPITQDRGQLFNASRTYRKAKKQRRLAKLAAKERPSLEDDANSGEEEGPVPDAGTDPPQTTHIDRRRDMYKIMDGSCSIGHRYLRIYHIYFFSPRGVMTMRRKVKTRMKMTMTIKTKTMMETEDGDEDEDGDGDGDEDKDEDADGDGDGDGDLDEDEDPDEDGEDPGSDENNIDDPDEWGPRDDRSESDEEDSD